MRSMPDLRIEIVYALADEQRIERIVVAAGSTVQDALTRSEILRQLPPEAISAYGIFGRKVTSAHSLADGDRIEIYRPLRADPRAARRARAKPRRRSKS